MNTSDSSPSKPVNLTVPQLRELFWDSQIMESFRQGQGSEFRVDTITTLSSLEVARWLFAETPLTTMPPREVQTYVFTFTGAHFGSELWLAVICGGRVIIPPFRLEDDRSLIPYFPEEVARCSHSL